ESGGCDTPPWIAPLRRAAVRFAAEPTGTMLTSLSGSSPIFRRATRVAISEDEPGLDTPTFLPLRSFTVLISATTSRTKGYTPASCAITTRSATFATAAINTEQQTMDNFV